MLRRFFSVFVFIVLLAAFPLVAVQAAAPAATRSDVPADRGLVVRIYYSDPAELAALRSVDRCLGGVSRSRLRRCAGVGR